MGCYREGVEMSASRPKPEEAAMLRTLHSKLVYVIERKPPPTAGS